MPKPSSNRKGKKIRRRPVGKEAPGSVISLRVNDSVKKSLERYARRSRCSLSEVLREALECWSVRNAVPLVPDSVRIGQAPMGQGFNC